MSFIRTRGLPLWVTVLAVLLGLFATFLGVSALLDPRQALGYVPGAHQLALGWGGRNAGLGIVLLVAVLLRSPSGYVVAFAGQVLREVSDIVSAYPNTGGIGVTLIFLAVDLLGLAFSIRALRRAATPPIRTPPIAAEAGR